jgi:hypothetical protein
MTIKLFGGVELEGGSPELQQALILRSAFIESYCAAKGWKEPLTIQQLLEIRSQDGWKNPTGSGGATQ